MGGPRGQTGHEATTTFALRVMMMITMMARVKASSVTVCQAERMCALKVRELKGQMIFIERVW